MPDNPEGRTDRAQQSCAIYRVIGFAYTVLGLPALIALITGGLHRGGNPYFALSIMGIPLGVLLLLFGFRRAAPNNLSEIAMRVAGAGLINLVFMAGSKVVMDNFHPGFETAYRFFGVLVAFLGTAALFTAVAALLKKGR